MPSACLSTCSTANSGAYLDKFDVSRPALMQALQIPAGPQDFEIAADALGFSDGERLLVVTPAPVTRKPTGTPPPRPPPTK